jgi:CubicO group peptidase (beta-lactamase class C family)
MTTTLMTAIHGSVAPGFEEVEVQFNKNFSDRGELGAACAAYRRGKKVVDLWGGLRDARNNLPWEEDTLVLVFSTTKGVAAMAMLVAHSQGLFDLDEPVVSYWPEFAQQGKEHITMRQLLSHQAGLCAVDEPLSIGDLANLDALADILARQKPHWEPGARHGYHGITLGWYEGELIRRVDPKHRTLGRFFHDRIAEPLDLEFHIGTPSEVPESRIAVIKDFVPIQMLMHLNKMPWRFALAVMTPWSLTARSFSNPRLRRPSDWGKEPLRSVEIPAANGIGSARSIAKAYGIFASGSEQVGLRQDTRDALATPANPPSEGPLDQILRVNTSFSFGYMKPFPGFRFGSSDAAFGTPGMGGSFGYGDPATGIGFAYTPNRCGYHLWDDPREKALRDALHDCLTRLDDDPSIRSSR